MNNRNQTQQHQQPPAQGSSKARGDERVRMTQIVIAKAEGRMSDAIKPGIEYRFTRWQDAARHLLAICMAKNPGRGYDKCGFRVTFADGYEHCGRYDAAHPDSKCHEAAQLGLHIRPFQRFIARLDRPEWITPAHWQYLTDTQPETEREDARRFLARYVLHDECR